MSGTKSGTSFRVRRSCVRVRRSGATTHKVTQIAGELLAPGEIASGQLLRLVHSNLFASESGMNILHLFVVYGNLDITNEIGQYYSKPFKLICH